MEKDMLALHSRIDFLGEDHESITQEIHADGADCRVGQRLGYGRA
jgi:hypothetical protein